MAKPFIIYVHGYMAPPNIMWPLSKRLEYKGLQGRIFGYPSTSGQLLAHAEDLRTVICEEKTDGRDIWIVAHSIGGLLARLAILGAPEITGMVLIATPSNGCFVAERLKAFPITRHLMGNLAKDVAAFTDIHKKFSETVSIPPIKIGIVAGGTGDHRGINPLIPGDNDGLIRVRETGYYESEYRVLLNQGHNVLPFGSAVGTLVNGFVRSGEFPAVPEMISMDKHAPP